MPIYQIQQTVPLSEVRLWEAAFDARFDFHEKADWYMAQIAYAADRRKYRTDRKISDYLLKFVPSKGKSTVPVKEVAKKVRSWFKSIAASYKTKNRGKKKRK